MSCSRNLVLFILYRLYLKIQPKSIDVVFFVLGESGDESSSQRQTQKVVVDVQHNVQQQTSTTVVGDTTAQKQLPADDHKRSQSSRSLQSQSSSSSNVVKSSDAPTPFKPATLDEFKRWLFPTLTLSLASYLSVVMGNFLSYLVRRDILDRPEFQTPLHDYILPEWNPEFDFDGVR